MPRQSLAPFTLIFGPKQPQIRVRMDEEGNQRFFCINNRNLHLTEEDFEGGTYPARRFLGDLCREACSSNGPCPAFAASWDLGLDGRGLANVETRSIPDWEACAGVQKLLEDMELTAEERFVFLAYLSDRSQDEKEWRDAVVARWNDSWASVKGSRSFKFDWLMWETLRFPALIPQTWMNYLYGSSERILRAVESNPSRVDFVLFSRGERYVIEIDGPSHYAAWDGSSLKVDERAYARNLKIERSLRRNGWHITRIGRIEVRDVMESPEKADFDPFDLPRYWSLTHLLPLWGSANYPPHPSYEELGVPELQPALFLNDVDIPF